MIRIDVKINFDEKLIEVLEKIYVNEHIVQKNYIWYCYLFENFDYCGFKQEDKISHKLGKLKKLKLNQKKAKWLIDKVIKEIRKQKQNLKKRKKESKKLKVVQYHGGGKVPIRRDPCSQKYVGIGWLIWVL